MRILKIFISIFLICCTATLFAQGSQDDAYLISNNYPVQDLADFAEILVDEESTLDINTIRDAVNQQRFQPYAEVIKAPYNSSATYWLRIPIRSEVTLDNWWLLLSREEPAIYFDTDFRYITSKDHIEVYYLQEDVQTEKHRTGLFIPASQKAIKKEPRICRVPFSIEAGQALTIYVCSKDIITSLVHRLHPELRDAKFGQLFQMDHWSFDRRLLMAIQAVLGFLLFSIFVFSGVRAFLLLSLVCTFIFLHYPILDLTGKGITFFVPEHPYLIRYIWVLTTTGSHFFLILFIREFSDLKNVLPRWNVLSQVILGMLVLHALVSFIYLTFFPSANEFFHFILIAFLSTLVLLGRIVMLQSLESKVLGFGAFFMIFFSVLGILWNLGIVTLPFVPWSVGQVGMVFIFTVGLAIRLQRNERAKAEAARIREVDAIKSRFFANISHEFRTPLTLIINPLKKIEEQIPASDLGEEGGNNTQVSLPTKYIHLMRRNADRLLQLINQLLDLSKLENGNLQLQLQRGDIIPFLRAMVFSFESLAERKQIYFQTQFPEHTLTGFYDKDKLEKIITNLLSNAFKYTPDQGTVSVQVSGDQQRIRIQVKDTGTGMKKEDLEKIFDRFYQVEGTEDQGSGIGLSLVKELVALHHGQISVDSVLGQGTTFKVSLPIGRNFFEEKDIVDVGQLEEQNTAFRMPAFFVENPNVKEVSTFRSNGQTVNLPNRVLIVEDNPDLQVFIAEHLENDYQILTAADGEEGLNLAIAHQPELIISDVMMPKMTGTEMCEKLKTNEITSHIPVILLTAKAGLQHKLAGLETGADAYLTKPFDGVELSLRVAKLIEQRQRMRNQFSKAIKLSPKEVAVTSVDEQFLQSVMDQIESNIDNEFFSVEDLAEAVHMSRSHLHRKLKALCDQSPNQLIRNFRLERAKELLEKRAGNISEIAFQVGYSSLSYFTKSFKAQYGCLPSEV